MPTRIAPFRLGSARRSCWTPGRRRRSSSANSRRNGCWSGSTSIPVCSVGGPPAIVSCSAVGSLPIASSVVARLPNMAAFCSADRGDDRGGPPERREEPRELRPRVGERLGDRLQVRQQRVERLERLVERGAAAGEAVAVAVEVLADRVPGRLVEGVADLVELGLGDERAVVGALVLLDLVDREDLVVVVGRVVVVVGAVEDEALGRPGPVAAGDLEVLEAERRLVTDPEDRVLGDRRRRLVELQVEPGDDAVGVRRRRRPAGRWRRRCRRCRPRRPRGGGPRRSTRRRRPGCRRSGPRCWARAGRRSGRPPRPGRRARTAGRCWRCRRGTRRR